MRSDAAPAAWKLFLCRSHYSLPSLSHITLSPALISRPLRDFNQTGRGRVMTETSSSGCSSKNCRSCDVFSTSCLGGEGARRVGPARRWSRERGPGLEEMKRKGRAGMQFRWQGWGWGGMGREERSVNKGEEGERETGNKFRFFYLVAFSLSLLSCPSGACQKQLSACNIQIWT